MPFYRKHAWQRDPRKIAVDSSSVIAKGDLVQSDESSGDLLPGATNEAVLGIAEEDSASGSTAKISVDILKPGEMCIATVEAGTPATTIDGKLFDINSQDGITLSASTNDDVRAWYNGTSDTVDVIFTTLEASGPRTE